jgi:hypothetical protein
MAAAMMHDFLEHAEKALADSDNSMSALESAICLFGKREMAWP